MTEPLVPGPSPLQRGLEKSGDTLGRVGPALARIPRLGRSETPDDWLPWVLVDKGLEMIVPYVRDLPKALREGPAWLRIRGGEPAIEIGIGWVESEGKVAPADGIHPWSQFQVGFSEPPESMVHAQQLVGMINLSKSSWDELFRLYSLGYDHRPVRMNAQRFDDGGWMDGYSGEQRWDGGPIISFGREEVGILDLDPVPNGGAVLETTRVVDWFDDMRFDRDRFSDRPRAIWETATESDGTTVLFDSDDSWPERWSDLPWSQSGGPSVFVAVARHDSATIVTGFDDDAWPDTHPEDTWRASTGSSPIPTELETV